MGPFLRKHAIDRTVHLKTFENQTVAVDTPIFVYRFLAAKKKHWLQGFRNQLESFRRHNVTPIYVFDGPPVALKHDELAKRKETKERWKKQADDASLPFFRRVQAMEYLAGVPTSTHYTELKAFLKQEGVRFEIARDDGEKHCARLTSHNLAVAVFSQDFDTLVYGGKRLVCCSNVPGKFKEYALADVLNKFGWTQEEFVNFCVLCGSDFGN